MGYLIPAAQFCGGIVLIVTTALVVNWLYKKIE